MEITEREYFGGFAEIREILDVQPLDGEAKPYQIRQPRRYTPGFTGAVAELTDEVLFAGLADYLTIEELRGVAFRRDMILVDIESRAPGCFMEADDVNERASGIGTLLYGAACLVTGEG